MRKIMKVMIAASAMTMLMAVPAYAAGWNQDSKGWTYQREDGSTPKSGWEWIAGKCYYFAGDGYILTSTTTPDNYLVNADGAWVVNGVVQTQGDTVASSNNYDPQYPLKGSIEQFFDHNKAGSLIWKNDFWEIPWDYNEEVKAIGPSEYVFNCAVRDKEIEYFNHYRGVELAALAELSGYPQTGLDYIDQAQKTHLVGNIKSFLNSFDFRNASDYEKAVNIANWIVKANYSTEKDQCNFAYGCLVNGYASCDGYTAAANLLATCVGLKSNNLGDFTHAYPIFLVDGIWLAYEPTSKDDYFTIAEVYTPGHCLDGVGVLMQIGEYCRAIGYKVPDPSYLTGRFPKLKAGIKDGEQTQFVVIR